ncbi:hypothetical protein SD77_0647 [Bacillus badius]|uniref:Uncharacterized protein n=1 Tax=Bacillus badius TaxID=1455 RepID=A0ABR5B1F7_BACBA|nr:hypothetical protein SD77_0647 [Bacillus badius]
MHTLIIKTGKDKRGFLEKPLFLKNMFPPSEKRLSIDTACCKLESGRPISIFD